MTDEKPEEPLNEAQIASSLMPLQIIAETVVGYHRKLVDGGIPVEIAGNMAQEFHNELLATLKSQRELRNAQVAAGALGGIFGGKRG